MRADSGDSTVGIALESKLEGTGKIKVLISRRNKSLAVEEVEKLVSDRVADMAIEDEVNRLIATAVEKLNLDARVEEIVDPKLLLLSTELTVVADDLKGEIINTKDSLGVLSLSLLDLASRQEALRARVTGLEALNASVAALEVQTASSTAETADVRSRVEIVEKELAGLKEKFNVEVVEIKTASTTVQTAFVVNQTGSGDVADFKSGDVSIMNVSSAGKVVIVGELEVDGRILVCSSGACSSRLDAKVDDTMGDLGVEGKVVAGAYEGYCEEGFEWVPGSAEYGTLPGFCVMAAMATLTPDPSPIPNVMGEGSLWTNISQGEADIRCQSLGAGYHLMSDAEWMTIAENITRVAGNDADPVKEGLQLQTADDRRQTTEFILTNGNAIYGLSGAGEWTKGIANRSDLPLVGSYDLPSRQAGWAEYSEVSSYRSLGIIRPPYYMSDAENGIGKIKTGESTANVRGYVRGVNGIYSLDLSHSPSEALAEVGFRCAK